MTQANTETVRELRGFLADTFVLYFKTHSFHWNVEGPYFKPLHDLFETQYKEMWEATDEIAERIRALGSYAPDNLGQFMKVATLQETGQTPDAHAMLEMLANDNEKVSGHAKKVLMTAQQQHDEATADLMIKRIAVHDKAAWMLRSSAKRNGA